MKPHYPILDGLRGTAAILVVAFHLIEANYPVLADHPMHHGYLAVDFFFLLSGFVIGYAYDDRWPSMSVKTFFKIRLVRLHPLVVISIVIGSIAYWFDPFSQSIPARRFSEITWRYANQFHTTTITGHQRVGRNTLHQRPLVVTSAGIHC